MLLQTVVVRVCVSLQGLYQLLEITLQKDRSQRKKCVYCKMFCLKSEL